MPSPPPDLRQALALHRAGKLAEARRGYESVLQREPQNTHALHGLALVQLAGGRMEEAVVLLRQCLVLRPRFAEALTNLGRALLAQNQPLEALAAHEAALAINPNRAEIHGNLGNTLKFLHRPEEAIAAYQRALKIWPDSADLKYNEALARLLMGDLPRGWENYECRWDRKKSAGHRPFAQPAWRGQAPLRGKSILVHAEQGLGDTLQFVRYVPLLAEQGAEVHLEVQPPLRAFLAEQWPGVRGRTRQEPPGDGAVWRGREREAQGRDGRPARPVGLGMQPPPGLVSAKPWRSRTGGTPVPTRTFDLHCPLLSLPGAFGTGLDSIPAGTGPYLKAPADKAAAWRRQWAEKKGPKIGLVWSGSAAHQSDRHRSISLADFRRIFRDLPGNFFSLQKDVRPGDAAILATLPEVTDLGPQLHDFAETAAIAANLDLVITVDTAVAHLAGALGVRTWLLLPFAPDWRWLLERKDSPWYASLRLFRQPAPGDWASVLEEVRSEVLRSAP